MSEKLAVLGGTPVRTGPLGRWPICDERDEQAVLRVLRSGRWGRSGDGELECFEARFAEYCGARYGVTVTNGTVALRIALWAAGVGPGDEVIVPPYTFLATATAVVECNATPIFVDIEPQTYNLDPERFEKAITPRTKAVIPVHLAGLPADMDTICEIARRHGITVIEDAAHAHGSAYKGRRCGSLGDMACFSFQSSKNLNSGEGGIILTSDERLFELCRSIHNCGRLPGGRWYDHNIMSGNYRLSEMQAALLHAQMDRLDELAARREQVARRLTALLGDVPGIEPLPYGPHTTAHAYHLYVIRYDETVYGVPRATYCKAIQAEGVPLSEGYVLPLYRQPLFANRAFGPFLVSEKMDYNAVSCPVCERACGTEGTWLWQGHLLASDEDVERVGEAFHKLYRLRDQLREVPNC